MSEEISPLNREYLGNYSHRWAAYCLNRYKKKS